MPQFVLLEHTHPALHWDLMLDTGTVLRSWRLHEFPELGRVLRAEPAQDHRRIYLEYEGPVGGDRGRVRRVVSGNYQAQEGAAPAFLLEAENTCWRLEDRGPNGWAFWEIPLRE